MTPLDIALGYIARGWNPLPLPFRTKRPEGSAWQTRVIDATTAPLHFNGAQQNVGVILGPSSRGLTDVDLDAPEAVVIGPYLLPPTRSIFGRASKRASHREYYTDLSTLHHGAVVQLKAPEGAMLVELRIGGGGMGAQTVFPGSAHKETGEQIEWEDDGDPADVDGGDLLACVKLVAAAALIARRWPEQGGRHAAALTLGGFLARAGFPEPKIKLVAEAIARAASDEEWRDRRQAAEDAARQHRGGGRAFGLPKLIEIVGEPAANKVAEWLDYDARGERQDHQQHHDGLAMLRSVCASSVVIKPVHWLWPQRFALGKLGLIVGLPDEGKGQLLCDITARVTRRGSEWPCGEGVAPLGNVVVLTAEDDTSGTVVPRLIAAAACLERVHFISMVCDSGKDRMFSLITDLQMLRQKIVEIGDVMMVQIDPISAYLGVGKIDSFRTTDVRAVLGAVVKLAAELQIAIIGVMHFNKKTDVTNALLRICDSLAFGAVRTARLRRDRRRREQAQARSSAPRTISPLTTPTRRLAFHFGVREVGTDPRDREEIMAPYILWEPQLRRRHRRRGHAGGGDNKIAGGARRGQEVPRKNPRPRPGGEGRDRRRRPRQRHRLAHPGTRQARPEDRCWENSPPRLDLATAGPAQAGPLERLKWGKPPRERAWRPWRPWGF